MYRQVTLQVVITLRSVVKSRVNINSIYTELAKTYKKQNPSLRRKPVEIQTKNFRHHDFLQTKKNFRPAD